MVKQPPLSKKLVIEALKLSKGNVEEAARRLQRARTTVKDFVLREGIDAKKFSPKSSETLVDVVSTEEKLRAEISSLRSQLRAFAQQKAFNDLAEEFLGLIKQTPISSPKWAQPKRRRGVESAIANIILSDTHFDEFVDPEHWNFVNAYDREIATLRLQEFTSNAIKLSRDYTCGVQMDGLVLNLNGDMFSGMIHDELRESNTHYIGESFLYWLSQLVSCIKTLLEFFSVIHIVGVPGNHGRMTEKKRHKGIAKTSFDWLLYKVIEREFAHIKEVTFSITNGADMPYSIYKTNFVATHGDQFKGGTGISGALAPLMLGSHRKMKNYVSVNAPFDHLVIGHFHQYLPIGPIIVNGSLKGYDEFAADLNFNFELPRQAMMLVDPIHGIVDHRCIHVLHKDEQWLRDPRAQFVRQFAR